MSFVCMYHPNLAQVQLLSDIDKSEVLEDLEYPKLTSGNGRVYVSTDRIYEFSGRWTSAYVNGVDNTQTVLLDEIVKIENGGQPVPNQFNKITQ